MQPQPLSPHSPVGRPRIQQDDSIRHLPGAGSTTHPSSCLSSFVQVASFIYTSTQEQLKKGCASFSSGACRLQPAHFSTFAAFLAIPGPYAAAAASRLMPVQSGCITPITGGSGPHDDGRHVLSVVARRALALLCVSQALAQENGIDALAEQVENLRAEFEQVRRSRRGAPPATGVHLRNRPFPAGPRTLPVAHPPPFLAPYLCPLHAWPTTLINAAVRKAVLTCLLLCCTAFWSATGRDRCQRPQAELVRKQSKPPYVPSTCSLSRHRCDC